MRGLKFNGEFGVSDILSVVALIASGFALYQTYEGNAPHVIATGIPARSHVVCDRRAGAFTRVALVPFRLSNVGGRATTLVGLSARPGVPPVAAVTDTGPNDSIWYRLTLLDTIGRVPGGIDAPAWQVDSVVSRSRPLNLKPGPFVDAHPPALDITLQPGESETVVLALTSLYSDPGGGISEFDVGLEAEFSHGEVVPLQTRVAPRRVGRLGFCP